MSDEQINADQVVKDNWDKAVQSRRGVEELKEMMAEATPEPEPRPIPNARVLAAFRKVEKEYQLRMSAAKKVEKGIRMDLDERRAFRRAMTDEQRERYDAAMQRQRQVEEQKQKVERNKRKVSGMKQFSINGQVYFAHTRKAAEKQAGEKNVKADRGRRPKGLGWKSPMKKKRK